MTAHRGQSLLEVLVATGIFVFIVSAIAFLILEAYSANRQGAERTQAVALSHEGVEAAKSLKNQRYGNLAPGDHGVTAASGSWRFAGANDVAGKYTRTVTVSPVSRDAAGNIVTSGGTPDFDTRRVTSRIAWLFTPLRQNVVELTTLLTNWRGRTRTHTTQADFDAVGTQKVNVRSTNVSGGELRLTPGPGGPYGNEFQVTSTSPVGLMNSSTRWTAMRFTAQRTIDAVGVRFYVDAVDTRNGTPSFRAGIQADNGSGLPDGTWIQSQNVSINQTGWRTVTFLLDVAPLTAGQVYHLVVQPVLVGNRRSASIRRSAPLNQLIPLDGTPDDNANTLFTTTGSWSAGNVQNQQPIYLIEDAGGSTEGNPYTRSTDVTIAGTTFVGETFTVSGGDRTVGSITTSVRKSGIGLPGGDLFVALEDVTAGTLVEQGVLVRATSATTTYADATYSFIAPIILQDTRTYRISFRSPASSAGGVSYRIRRLEHDIGAPYESVNFGGTTNQFVQSTNAGTSWSGAPAADLSYRFQLTTGFSPTGSFLSSAIDTGSNATLYNYLTWTATVPAGTTLRFQIRTANTVANLSTATWVGPDGTGATFFTSPGESITLAIGPPPASGTRAIQYQAFFTSTGGATPILEDVTVNYE